MRTKLLTLLVALIASIGNLSAYDFYIDGIAYNYGENRTVRVTSGVKYSGNKVIPSSVIYKNIAYIVTGIEEDAFKGCTGVKSVEIRSGVTSIGNFAFSGCSGLTAVTIPNSITSIGDEAFNGCSGLTKVIITNIAAWCDISFNRDTSNPLKYAKHLYLNDTEITNLIIPNSVTSIKKYAFSGCSGLTAVTIPNSITSIGDEAFNGCSGLTKVIITDIAAWCDISFNRDTSNPLKYAKHLYLNDTEITNLIIPNSVTSIKKYAFYGCTGLTSIEIPNSVITIEDSAFGCTGLISVTIPNSVESIGNDAFSRCTSLASVTIGNSVESIGSGAFWWCSALTSVIIPNSVKSIENQAFGRCGSLTSIEISNSVTSIGDHAFEDCSGLTSVTIPNSVKSIGSNAFEGCSSLTSVTIPNSVKSIGSNAFEGCSSLTSVTIPNSVTSIGDAVFSGCSTLTSVTINANSVVNKTYTSTSNLKNIFGEQITNYVIGDGVTRIGEKAFYGCTNLLSVTIPNSVTSIGGRAFYDCGSLSSLTIHNSITSIGDYAFGNCGLIEFITCEAVSPPALGASAFFYVNKSIPLYVPGDQMGAYWGASQWNEFSNIQPIPGTEPTSSTVLRSGKCGNNLYWAIYPDYRLVISGSGEMNNYSNRTAPWHQYYKYFTKVILEDEVTSIGDYAFSGCLELTSVTIGTGLTSIRDSAFIDCRKLTSVTINSNAILSKTYYYTSNLKTIFGNRVTSYVIGDAVTSIGQYAFYECTNLRSVTIGDSVTNIEQYAFDGCTGLKSVTIGTGLTNIEQYAFYGCTNITSVVWNAKNSSGYNFGAQVTSFTFGNEVEVIPASICSGMKNLTFITIPNSVTSIGDGAFLGCTGLTSVTIPNSITSIEERTFSGCRNLSVVTIPNSVTSIGRWAFSNCTKLGLTTRVEIPNSVTSIGEYAFYECTGLRYITIPNSVTSIEAYTFYNCTSLTSVTIPNSVTSIGGSAFSGCSSLTSIYVPCGEMARFKQMLGRGFEDKVKYAPLPYTITISATNGNVTYPQTICDEMSLNATPEYGYHFVKWSDGVTDNPRAIELTKDATFTAEFAKNTYTISTTSANPEWGTTAGGSALYLDEVEISATANYGYHFLQWNDGNTQNPRTVTITADKTYTATFAKNTYSLSVQSSNTTQGSVSGAGTFEYLAQKQITATANYGYHFTQWSDGDTNNPRTLVLTQDTAFTAEFTIDQYSITTQATNGTITGGGTYDYGTQINLTATANEHYHFVSWSDGELNATRQITVTEDKTYTAIFEKDKFLVLFLDENGTELKRDSIEYGVMPIAPANPTKVSTVQYDYLFNGWTPSVDIVTQAATYTATYTSSIRSYIVTFVNDDNSIISMQSYKYGEFPALPATPTKTATAEYTYTFAGWDPAVVKVTGDATYRATFNATKNSYTITWQNEDGSLINQTTVEYGVVPTHADPVKQNTAEYTYTFAGWTPNVVAVTGDATYKATFNATKNSYTITWQNENGSLIDQTTVEYGLVPTHADPVKQNTAEYTYTFAGWTPNVVAVTGDATYRATFNATKNSYTITWQNEDGSLIDQTTVEYGVVPTHADPVKQNTAEYTYTFAGWTPNVVAVTGDATYKATFNATKNSYTITWQNEDGSLIDQTTVEYGIVPTHADPVKQNTAEYTYTFAGWTPNVVAVTGDATYKATFNATKNSYTITWQNEDGSLIDQTTVEYGVVPTHAAPVKQNTAEYTYTFAGWDPAVVAVTGDATYKATFNATKNSYTITWQNEDGSLIDQTTVEYGLVPTHADPVKQNTAEYTYTFAGWTPNVVAVTGDATYRATFNSEVNMYSITSNTINGEVVGIGVYAYGTEVELEAIPADGYAFNQWSDGVTENPRTIIVTGNAEYTALFTSTEGIEDVYGPDPVQKVIIDNKVYILRGDKKFTLHGQEVK